MRDFMPPDLMHWMCPKCKSFIPIGTECGSAECRPRDSHAPCERPPANGEYDGPAKVRVLPQGVSLAERNGTSRYFQQCQKNGIKRNRKARA